MSTILITGASSGLGLAFLHHYSKSPSTQILALDISPLPQPFPSNPNITFHHLDITSPDALSSLITTQNLTQTPIILLLHCAGTRGLVQGLVRHHHGNIAATEMLEVMDHETMLHTFEVNTWGTFNVLKTFLPNLRLASGQGEKTKVVVLSSRMGSISANITGGGYAYRASKAALNAVVRSFSVDVPKVDFLLLHPGRVETGLVEWKEEGAVSVEESVGDCLKIIERLGKEGEGGLQSGAFVDRFGEKIEW